MTPTLTAERLRELVDYEPETGTFRCRVTRCNKAIAGSVCKSTVTNGGYGQIGIDRVSYRTGRLAWLWMTGEWPPEFVDHINGDPTDDRWANLRAASPRQNNANTRKPRHNTTGFKGVQRVGGAAPYQARIKFKGKVHYLGRFDDPAEASKAYERAAKAFHGEFARAR